MLLPAREPEAPQRRAYLKHVYAVPFYFKKFACRCDSATGSGDEEIAF